jgi:hypothetical protein
MTTPRQKAAIEKKLVGIKSALIVDKRKWGTWDDSRGLRYASPGLFIKIEDWQGGLKYLKWFAKNFPDDIGMPEFLFEWAIILFKSKKIKEAEHKVYQSFFSNTYLLDRFFGKSIIHVDKWEGSILESPEYIQYFGYTSNDQYLTDFSKWLEGLVSTDEFIATESEFITLNIKLKVERDGETRRYLIGQIRQLENSLTGAN